MKKKIIVSSLVALSLLAVAAGATSVLAAGPSSNGQRHSRPAQLTDAQKADLQTKMAAVNSAITANDYNAWVTAEKNLNANSPLLTKITADNFASYVAKYQAQATKMADQKAKMTAVKTALDSGDYTTWVTAEKALNANSPALTKITADNFSQYAQANKLREQADSIMQTLGLNGGGRGNGMGEGFGPGGNHGHMFGGMPGALGANTK